MSQVDVFYTDSANVDANGNTRVLVSAVAPNTSYQVTIDPSPQHMKSSTQTSGLEYTSTVGGTLSWAVSTPSDEVHLRLDLRKKNSDQQAVDLRLAEFYNANYPSFVYSGTLKVYSHPNLSSGHLRTQTLSTSMSDGTTTFSPNPVTVTGLTNMSTTPYYFAVDYTNNTLGQSVYTDATRSTVFRQRLYDVRGLAYFRAGATWERYDATDLSEPFAGTSTEVGVHTWPSLSADGRTLLTLYVRNGGQYAGSMVLALYRHVRDRWVACDQLETGLSETGTPMPRYGSGFWYTHRGNATLAADASCCAVVYAGVLRVYEITDGMTFGATHTLDTALPSVYASKIHDVTMSTDGRTVLLSAADTSSYTQGYAHAISLDETFGVISVHDLSSAQVPGYDARYSYGTDSCVSGDGRTAVICGSPSTGSASDDDTVYVWKYNLFSQDWKHVAVLPFAYDQRKVSVSLSHLGDVLFVAAPVGGFNRTSASVKAKVFESDPSDPAVWSQNLQITEDRLDSGGMSGDGLTIGYMKTDNTSTKFNVWRRASVGSSAWSQIVDDQVHAPPANGTSLAIAKLSLDGSVFVAVRHLYDYFTDGRCLYFAYGDKDGPVTQVLDYDAVRSQFRHIDYAALPAPTWDSASAAPEQDQYHTNRYHYGHVDSVSLSADGAFMLVGSPSERKAYLYDTTGSTGVTKHVFSGSTTRFGEMCCMDDLAHSLVIADQSTLYVYGTDGLLKKDIAHGFGNIPWNLKMSKSGTMIVASQSVGSTSFKGWTTGDDWASVSEVSFASSSTSKRVSAIDLSQDGSVVVGAGFKDPANNNSEGYLHVFSSAGSLLASRTLSVAGNLYIGQSVALSGDGNTVLLGNPGFTTSRVDGAYVFVLGLHPTNRSVVFEKLKYYPKASSLEARFGRSVSLSYDGSVGLVSGNQDELHEYTNTGNGNALLFNVVKDQTDPSGTEVVGEFFQASLAYNSTGSYSHRSEWNGYGIASRVSSTGREVAVTGGGYAFLYKNR